MTGDLLPLFSMITDAQLENLLSIVAERSVNQLKPPPFIWREHKNFCVSQWLVLNTGQLFLKVKSVQYYSMERPFNEMNYLEILEKKVCLSFKLGAVTKYARGKEQTVLTTCSIFMLRTYLQKAFYNRKSDLLL